MHIPTTITLIARVEDTEHKTLPVARLCLSDQCTEHTFTRPGEEHRFTVSAMAEIPGHEVRLEFVDHGEAQAALSVIGVNVNGSPMGTRIYQCEYTPYHSNESLDSRLYMGWPGTWRLRLHPDDFRSTRFGFV